MLSTPQLQLHMQEVQDEIKVSWEVSCLDTEGLQVTPVLTQVNLKVENSSPWMK